MMTTHVVGERFTAAEALSFYEGHLSQLPGNLLVHPLTLSLSFEPLLDGAIGGPALGLEIKKAEMATKDLITLVKYSQLKSRDLLAESLFNFVQDAKKTGKGLQKLTSKVNGAVDQ